MNIFENFKKLGKIQRDNLDYEVSLEISNIDQSIELGSEKKEEFKVNYFYLIVFLVISLYIGQLFKLQVVEGKENQFLAEGNRIRSEEYRAPRGIIYDRDMNALVKNVPLYNLEIMPLDLPKEKSERIIIYDKLKSNLTEDVGKIAQEIEDGKLYSPEPEVIKAYLSKDDAIRYELLFNDLPGVRVSVMPGRQYENIAGLSHILGYIGKINEEQLKTNSSYSISDFIGQTGLESSFESYLMGIKGQKKVEVDSTGRIQRQLEEILPIPGNDLVTSIDKDLQSKSAEILKAKIDQLSKDKKDVKHAVVVIINPQTGGILSMVSIPSYDNNLFSRGITSEDYDKLINDPENPMLNRAISGIYPSGSIIKPFIAAAGLDKGTISENTTINDPGEIKIGEWSFVDWKNHGTVDVRKAIAESCNVFFYAIGGGWEQIKGIGVEAMKNYLNRFGFGKATGLELSGEEGGNVPDADWKKDVKDEDWYLGDTYHMAIGQGDILVTPLQMVTALSAVANGGKLYQPHFVEKILDQEGNIVKTLVPVVINEKPVDNSNSIEVVRQGMKLAVDSSSGSARQLQDLPVSSAGKTGTAQFDANDLKHTHSWFEAFAPYNNPEIAIVVLVEGGGDGFDAAEPVAKDIMKYYFENK